MMKREYLGSHGKKDNRTMPEKMNKIIVRYFLLVQNEKTFLNDNRIIVNDNENRSLNLSNSSR